MASIRKLLPTLIVLQISLAMGLTGAISFFSAKKQVHQLIGQLSKDVSQHIHHEVMAYLQPSMMVHEINHVAILNGNIKLNDIENLQRYFWRIVVTDSEKEKYIERDNNDFIDWQIHSITPTEVGKLESVSYIMFGGETGEFIGVEEQEDDRKVVLKIKEQFNPERITYELDVTGNKLGEISRRKYDPRSRPWYQAAKQAGKLTWSEIYTSSYDRTSLRISPVMPIYERGALLGVLGIEMTLRQLSDFLSELNISPNGKAFIIESSGKLVATSVNEILSISTPEGTQRMSVTDSSDSAIKATMEKILADANMMQQAMIRQKQFKLKIDGQLQFIQIKPLAQPDLDWVIIVVIPESDFMENIYKTLRIKMLLSLVALGSLL
jgi:hypothetical protein